MSIVCLTAVISLGSTSICYAETIKESEKLNLQNQLKKYEYSLEVQRNNFNLDDNDTIEDNLEVEDIYKNNIIVDDNIKFDNEYVGTIKLKDSGKPIALAFIKKKNSKLSIERINSDNILEDEVNQYKNENEVSNQPLVVIDEANDIYAITSKDQDNLNELKIVEDSMVLDLDKDENVSLDNIVSKLKKENKTINNDAGGHARTNENNKYMLIATIIFIIGLFSLKKYFKYNR